MSPITQTPILMDTSPCPQQLKVTVQFSGDKGVLWKLEATELMYLQTTQC